MEWISMKENLPPLNQPVLAYDDRHETFLVDSIIAINESGFKYIWGNQLAEDFYNISHWMYLPSKPKDANEMD